MAVSDEEEQQRKEDACGQLHAAAAPQPLGPFTMTSPVSVMSMSPPPKMSAKAVHHDPGL